MQVGHQQLSRIITPGLDGLFQPHAGNLPSHAHTWMLQEAIRLWLDDDHACCPSDITKLQGFEVTP
jgi:hypothetical protein